MLVPAHDLQHTDFLKGALILLDKPKGWTSFDAVNKIRYALKSRYNIKKIKVGHSGTLDPMATGLLLICTGGWTKELHQLQGLDKTYIAEITLGIETDSYDAEGEVISQLPVPDLSMEGIKEIFKSFTGEFLQIPPVYSAIKKEGKPLYQLARAGKQVKPEPRQVTVFEIRLLKFESSNLTLHIHCGSGFYVRSLAHDIGEKLGCGAHLSALSRIKVGNYDLDHAWSMDSFLEGFR